MTWQRIETAPKDGQDIILAEIHTSGDIKELAVGSWGTEVSDWDGSRYKCWLTDTGNIEDPTHWIPLPEIVL